MPSPKNSAAPSMPSRRDERLAARPADDALGQRHQRENAAFAVVVGAHDEHDVFDGHDTISSAQKISDRMPRISVSPSRAVGGGRDWP